jgi:hypothetical protein
MNCEIADLPTPPFGHPCLVLLNRRGTKACASRSKEGIFYRAYLTQVATYRTPTIEIVANVAKSAFAD